jgi:hypothetical protein
VRSGRAGVGRLGGEGSGRSGAIRGASAGEKADGSGTMVSTMSGDRKVRFALPYVFKPREEEVQHHALDFTPAYALRSWLSSSLYDSHLL